MLRRCLFGLCLSVIASCGGGGGGSSTPPVVATSRLAAPAIEIVAGSNSADLLVNLETAAASPPALLQVAIDLPTALTLPANGRLQAVAQVANLDGDFVDGAFVVLVGDAQNHDAPPLTNGPLFRLRLEAAQPRQPGTYTVHLRNLLAASSAGDAAPVDATPVAVDVIIR